MRVDWAWIGITFIWVLGLSLILVSVSIANYRTALQRTSILKELRQKECLLLINIGAFIFLVGLLLTALPVSQKLVWAFPVAWCMVGTWFSCRKN